jgi:hypothetical protein
MLASMVDWKYKQVTQKLLVRREGGNRMSRRMYHRHRRRVMGEKGISPQYGMKPARITDEEEVVLS